MIRIRKILCNIYFFPISILLYLFYTVLSPVVFLLTLPFGKNRKAFHYFLSLWAWSFVQVNPLWTVRIEGKARLPKGAYVMCANHQSLMDIIVLYCIWSPFKWVAKRELFRVPIIGWMLSLGDYVSIRRASRADARRMVDACVTWLSRGVPIMIFPEGTRGQDPRIERFKAGAVSIAQRAQVPIVPITVTGSFDMMQHFLIAPHRTRVTIHIHPPIETAEVVSTPAQALNDKVEEIVREQHVKMRPHLYATDA